VLGLKTRKENTPRPVRRRGLSLSGRLARALSLFMVPLAFVTFQLVAEQQKAIAFASAERLGVACLEPVADAEFFLHAPSSAVDRAAIEERLVAARDQCGARLGVEAGFDAAIVDFRSGAASAEALHSLRTLRRDIGDRSNLILDPDLDSYYVMDVIVAAAPAVLEALTAVGREREALAGRSGSSDRLAVAVSLYQVAQAELEFSLDAALRGASDDRLRASLADVRTKAREAGDAFAAEFLARAELSLRGRTDVEVSQAHAADALAGLRAVASAELDRLLSERIARFERSRFVTLLVAFALFGAALAITIIMLRRGVVHPIVGLTKAIRALAEGDYESPVPLQNLRDEVGEIARALEVLRGVARDKIAADAARLSAESANQAKSRFIANMSHELRTPLNAVIGFTEMVIEDIAPDSPQAEDLRRVTAAAAHLLSLINDILDLAKIEAGRHELHLAAFPVPALVEEVMNVAAPLAAKSGAKMRWRVEASVLQGVSDERRLKQCLLNLVSNACKFAEGKTVDVSVSRSQTEAGAMLMFRVADTGRGMTPEQLDRVFRPFEQADSSIELRHGGTGLGLSITRTLARALGGDVRLESTFGVGTVAHLSVRDQADGAGLVTASAA
jgi:signal transduction histidine kinase